MTVPVLHGLSQVLKLNRWALPIDLAGHQLFLATSRPSERLHRVERSAEGHNDTRRARFQSATGSKSEASRLIGRRSGACNRGLMPLPNARRLTAGSTRRCKCRTVSHILWVENKTKQHGGANRSASRRTDPFCGTSRTAQRAIRGWAHWSTPRAAGPRRHPASAPPLRDPCAPRRRVPE
jgi:hypothetical protein